MFLAPENISMPEEQGNNWYWMITYSLSFSYGVNGKLYPVANRGSDIQSLKSNWTLLFLEKIRSCCIAVIEGA